MTTDDAAASPLAAAAVEQARREALEAELGTAGSQVGVQLDLPPVVSDWSKHTGGSDAHGDADG